MTPYDLRNKLSRFLIDTKDGVLRCDSKIIICVGDNWYEARKTSTNKDSGEVFIDAGKKIRDSRGDIRP